MALDKLQGQLSAFVSTWTEDATASGSAATATHAAEANKSHYITGFSVSSYDGSSGAGTSTIEIKDDTDVIMTIYKENGGGLGGDVTHSFSSPIQITEGNPCSISIINSSSYDYNAANLWGFTS